MYYIYGFLLIPAAVASLLALKTFQMAKGRKKGEDLLQSLKLEKIRDFGSVNKLSILPLIDYYAKNSDYSTEEGASFFIEADDKRILFDVGFNKRNEHPSPLLKNMNLEGIDPAGSDMIFISHLHRDNLGGTEYEGKREFSLSAGDVKLKNIPVYAPDMVSPSKYNPGPQVKVVAEPEVLAQGVASIGVHPRSLFLIGYTLEHSMVVNLKGKGLVIIIGCGHQGIEAILDRVTMIFDEPVYAIIGGLHFPVNGGRVMAGPFNMQNIVGVDSKPWKGIVESHVESAIEKIKSFNPQIIAISAHDSSDWAIDKFKSEFGDKYREIIVGERIDL